MPSSMKNNGTRSVFDVQKGNAPRRRRSLREFIHGKNVLNLRPRFAVRHPWMTAVGLVAAAGFIFWGAERLSTRAEVSDFFPITCLGTWQNPANAQGKPAALGTSFSSGSSSVLGVGVSSSLALTEANSAVFDPTATSSQIFCGGFVPPDYQAQGNIQNAGLTLVWNIPVLATTTVASDTSAGGGTVPATTTMPTNVPTGTAASGTSWIFFPVNVAFADTSDTATTASTATIQTPTPTPVSVPPVDGSQSASATSPAASTTVSVLPPTTTTTTTTTITTTTTTVDAASDTTSTTVVVLPPITATLGPATSSASTTGTGSGAGGAATGPGNGTSSQNATTTASATPPVALPPAPVPDTNFLKVSYSLDGQTWIELSTVGPMNWQNFTATLPITNWSDLKKLQVKIEGIPTALTQIPKVYLNGMFVEVHYDIPPPLPVVGGGSGSNGNSPADGQAPGASQVIVLPPAQQPVPTNHNDDFNANQSPTFDFNLNALPGAPPPAMDTANTTTSTSTSTSTSTTPSSTSFSAPSPIGRLLSFFLDTIGVSRLVARAQSSSAGPGGNGPWPDQNNPVVAQIFGPDGNLTNLQPVILITGGNLRVTLPNSGRAFVPGRYLMKLLILQNGTVYATQSMFTWGVLAVNFNKSVYMTGDMAQIYFGLLNPLGHTVCYGNIEMDIQSPSGRIIHFSTASKSPEHAITRSPTCGPQTVTNHPDYYARMKITESGSYLVSVVGAIPGTDDVITMSDGFSAQAAPQFSVERVEATRIYPPATYAATIRIIPGADYNGLVVESLPASFTANGDGAVQSLNGDSRTLTWQIALKAGQETDLSYSFLAPDISPELYKLGPLTIGSWQETRQWQIAADAGQIQIFITSTASTTWTVPTDWNNTSNTIEVIGGGGGGNVGNSNSTGGGGGGGGAYAKGTNFSTSTGNIIKVQVGSGGAAKATGTIAFFSWNGSGSTSTCSGTTMFVCATAGSPGMVAGSGGAGGASSTSVGATRNAGGGGGSQASGIAGGGGGGAAGLNGNGNFPNVGTATTTGGSADAGLGGAGGAPGSPGGTGGAGTEWGSFGSGGGGGAANVANGIGGPGGNYGGGGGGGTRSGGTGGAGAKGIIVITYPGRTITLADGTQPAPVTIAPSAAATTSDVFSFQTNYGTSSVNNVTVNLSTSTGIYQVQIANAAGTTVYGSSTNPGSASVSINTANMNVSTTLTTFTVLVQPKTYANMPLPANADYAVTSTVTAWTDVIGLDQSGTNTTSSVVTIDNSGPGPVTNASGTPTSTKVTLSWTNPGDTDFTTTTVLRATSSVTQVPVDGTNYVAGNTIGTSTVACVVGGSPGGNSSCTDSGLTNGTAYYYVIFAEDKYINYSPTSTVPGGNPFTPGASTPPSVSKVVLNGGSAIILTPAITTAVSVVASSTAGSNSILYATSTIYRSGVSGGSACTASNQNCYVIPSSSCAFTQSTTTVTCTANIWYFAQATDASSGFSGQTWQAAVTVTDSGSNTGSSSTASGVTLNTLLAINITTSSVNYGTITPSSTSAVNQTTTVQDVGNSSTTLQISGTALVSGANSIATSSQHYATSSFTYGGSEQVLSQTATTISGFLLTGPTSTSPVQGNVYWGIFVPAPTPTGTYNGTTTFTAIFSS